MLVSYIEILVDSLKNCLNWWHAKINCIRINRTHGGRTWKITLKSFFSTLHTLKNLWHFPTGICKTSSSSYICVLATRLEHKWRTFFLPQTEAEQNDKEMCHVWHSRRAYTDTVHVSHSIFIHSTQIYIKFENKIEYLRRCVCVCACVLFTTFYQKKSKAQWRNLGGKRRQGIGLGDKLKSGLKGMGFVWFDLNNIAAKYNMERP